jgi:hypothetical protein
MPEVKTDQKHMIYTKVMGVKGMANKAILEDESGKVWNLSIDLDDPTDVITDGGYIVRTKGKGLSFCIDGARYNPNDNTSMFSIMRLCKDMMFSRQRILRYMYNYPERVSNVSRGLDNLSVFVDLDLFNHDMSIFKFSCSIGTYNHSKYADTLQMATVTKLSEWNITGIKSNADNSKYSLGINIGIKLY